MKKTALIVIMLISFAGICYAEIDSACFDKCTSNNNASPADISYCKEKCSRKQTEYTTQSLGLVEQQIEIQKESLEIQRQSLEIQRQLLEIQKLQQEQASQAVQKPAEQIPSGKIEQ